VLLKECSDVQQRFGIGEQNGGAIVEYEASKTDTTASDAVISERLVRLLLEVYFCYSCCWCFLLILPVLKCLLALVADLVCIFVTSVSNYYQINWLLMSIWRVLGPH